MDKSYIPQYIQFEPNAPDLGSGSYGKSHKGAESVGDPYNSPPQILIYPGGDLVNGFGNGIRNGDVHVGYQMGNGHGHYQNNAEGLYPSLKDLKNEQRIPLLRKEPKKSHAPTKTSWFGITLAAISGIFFTLASGTVKYLDDIDPMELLAIRSLLQILITLPIALCKGQHLMGPQGSRMLLFAQGIVGGTTLVMLFYSFRLLPLGDAATIIFSSPVFVMVMSHLWLREPCGFYRTFIVFLLVTGVVLITKPPFIFARELSNEQEAFSMLGYAAALCGTLCTAINIVVMRKCKDVHFSVVVFQFSFWSLIISGILLLFTGEFSIPKFEVSEVILILIVAAFGLSGQCIVAVALQFEGAGRVAVTRSMDIVLAYVLQVTIFHEVPSWESVLGAGMVMACVVGMGLEDLIHRCFNTLP